MSDSSGDRNPVERLAEEFVARKRRGEKPTLSEYTDKYPELAAEIRDLFPALLMMEDLGDSLQGTTGPHIGAGLTVSQLGDYRILREVGRGGMGVVFEAEQLSLGRRVALKVLPRHTLKNDQQVRRFEREARAAARLHHTNIVPVFGVGRHEETHYYVMQFIQGLGLDGVIQELRRLRAGQASPAPPAADAPAVQHVAQSLLSGIFPVEAPSPEPGKAAAPPPPPPQTADSTVPRLPEGSDLSNVSGTDRRYWRSVARIGVQVAGALEYAHVQGILHRDVKPSNLLMDTKGTVWVTDFGLAKAGEEDALTDTGDVVGTLRYMAPERFRTSGDARSDVYSLGLTLYELLALRPAFTQRDRPQLVQQVLQEEPPHLRTLNRAVPRDLVTIVHKAIAKEPRQRYARAADLAADLQRFLDDRPILARPVSNLEVAWKWIRRRPGVAALLALLFLAILAGLSAFGWQYSDALAQKDQAVRERKDKEIAAENATREKERADKKAEEATNEKERADREARDARIAKGDAEKRATEASEANKQAQAALEKARQTAYTNALVQVGALLQTDPEHGLAVLEDPQRCPESRRDFTWGLLYRLCRRDRVLLPDQASGIGTPTLSTDGSMHGTTLTVSADGSTLATQDYQGRVAVWDVATGKERLALMTRVEAVQLLLTPDGKTLIVGPRDLPKPGVTPGGPAQLDLGLWDTTSGKLRKTLWSDPGSVSALFLSADGRLLAAAGYPFNRQPNAKQQQHRVTVWDLRTGEEVSQWNGLAGRVEALALAPDGKTLATAIAMEKEVPGARRGRVDPIKSGKLQLWSVASGKEIRELPVTGVVGALCFADNGQSLLGTSRAGVFRWDLASGQEDEPFEPTGTVVTALALSPSGHTLAGAGPGGITFWDLPRGNVRIQFRRGRPPIAFRDEDTLVSSGEDAVVRVWSLNPPMTRTVGKPPSPELFRQHGEWSAAGHAPDGKWMVIRSESHTVHLRDALTGKDEAVITGLPPTPPPSQGWTRPLEGPPPKVVLSPDGKTVGLLSAHFLRLCDARSGREIVARDGVGDFWFAPNGKTCAGEVGKLVPAYKQDPRFESEGLRVWDLANGKELCALAAARGAPSFSPDGLLLAASGKVWETATGQERDPVPAVAGVYLWGRAARAEDPSFADAVAPAAYHPASQLLATARKDSPGVVQLWDLARGKGPLVLAGHGGLLTALAFSPDGKTLASAGEDETVRLWETATGRQRWRQDAPFGQLQSLRFSADANLVIGEAGPKQLAFWDAANGRPHVFRAGAGAFTAVALGPDGRTFATASGPDVHLWDGPRETPSATLDGPGGTVTALAFADGGKTLTAWSARAVKRWDTATGRVLDAEVLPDDRPPNLEVSPDGRTLWFLHHGTLTFRDLRSGEERGSVQHALRLPTFSPDGRLCAVEVGGDRPGPVEESVTLWDVLRGQEIVTLSGARGPGLFSPNGKRFAAGVPGTAAGKDTDAFQAKPVVGIKVWDLPAGKEIASLERAEPILFRPDGDMLLVSQGNGRLLAWMPGSGKDPVELKDAKTPALFAPDGKVLAVSDDGRTITLRDPATGKELLSLAGHEGTVDGLACSPDGKTAASRSGKDRTVRLWDLGGKGNSLHVIPDAAYVDRDLTFVRDGKTLVVGALSRWFPAVFDVATGKPQGVAGENLALSPDGKTIARGKGEVVNLVEAQTGRIQASIATGRLNNGTDRLWFTADGKTLVRQGPGFLELWDAATGKELASYNLSARTSRSRAVKVNTPKREVPRLTPPPGRVFITPARRSPAARSTLDLHDGATGRKLGSLGSPTATGEQPYFGGNSCLAISPDGKTLATAPDNAGVVRLWNLEAGLATGVWELTSQPGAQILGLSFSGDGKSLLALLHQGGSTIVCQVDLATGQRRLLSLEDSRYQHATSCAFSADGWLVAYVYHKHGEPGKPATPWITVAELDGTRRAGFPAKAHNGHLAFSPDGKLLACLLPGFPPATKGEIKVIDWAAGKERLAVEVPAGTPAGRAGHEVHPLLAFTADGKTLAASYGSDTVLLWDVQTGKEQAAVKGVTGPAALMPDGKAIACLTFDGHLRLIEAATSKDRLAFRPFTGQSYSFSRFLSFAPDGTTVIVAGGTEGDLLLWQTRNDTLRILGPSTGQPTSCLAVAPDGRQAILGRRSSLHGLAVSSTVLLDSTGQLRPVGPWTHGQSTAAAWSPDGKTLALVGENHFWVTLWDTRTWQQKGHLAGHTAGLHCVAFSPDGKRLAAGSNDGKVRVWDVAESKELAIFEVGKERVTHLAFGPDGSILAAIAAGKTGARLWDLGNRKLLLNLPGEFKALAIGPDGKTLALADPKTVQFLDCLSGKEKSTLPAEVDWLWFAPDGKTLVFRRPSSPPETILWDLATGKERAKLPENAVLLAAQATTLATLTLIQGQPVLKTWDPATGTEQTRPNPVSYAPKPHPYNIRGSAIRPDETMAATFCENQVNLWDLSTRQAVASLPADAVVRHVVFSGDGKRLAVAEDGGVIQVWDVSPVRLRATRKGPVVIAPLLFSPDGGLIAHLAASAPGKNADVAVVRDVNGGAAPVLLRGHPKRIDSFAFSGDGSTLATRGEDGSVRIWDARSGKERRVLTRPPAPLPAQGLTPDGKTALTLFADAAGKRHWRRWSLAADRDEGTSAAADNEDVLEAPIVASIQREHDLKLVEPDSGRAHRVFHDVLGWNYCRPLFSEDGTHLATVSNKPLLIGPSTPVQRDSRPNTVQVWDAASGRLRTTFDCWVRYMPHEGVYFSPDNRLLALIGGEVMPPEEPVPDQPGRTRMVASKEVVLWEAESGKKHTSMVHDTPVQSAVFSKDGKLLATTASDQVIRLWDVATGRLVRALKPWTTPVEVLAFLADDKVLLVRTTSPREIKGLLKYMDVTIPDRTDVKLWDLAADQEHAEIPGSRSLVAWSPDHRTLATVRTEGDPQPEYQGRGFVIQVWDAATGHERAALAGHRTPIDSLRFALDGKALVSGSGTTTYLWALDTPDPAQRYYLQGNSWVWKNHPLAPEIPQQSSILRQDIPDAKAVNLIQAISRYREALRVNPDHAPARLALGKTLLDVLPKIKPEHQQRYRQEGLDALRELIQRRPRDAEAHFLLAGALAQSKTDDEAVQHYREALALEKDHAGALSGLGAALVRRGRLDEAREVYQRRVLLPPEDTEAFGALGKLLLQAGKAREAIDLLRKAVASSPARPQSLDLGVQNDLAAAYEQLGQLDEACETYRKAAAHWGAGYETHLRLARLLDRRGLLDEAVSSYRQAVAKQQDKGLRHAELGRALLRTDKPVEAAAVLRQAQDRFRGVSILPLPLAAWLHDAERLPALERKWTSRDGARARPTDAVGAVEFGLVCRYQAHYLAAARSFRDGFARQPALTGWYQDRYNAACAAVLASAGRGDDAAGLTEQEREDWRKQALDWLRADLAVRKKALDADPPRALATVYPLLASWQSDMDLAAVRERPEVTRLPQAEQEAWQQFWSEAAALGDRAASVPSGGWWVQGKEILQEQKIDAACWLRLGESNWTDYDLEVEALRVEGVDGFGIGFRMADRDNFLMANFGGWNNSRHGVEVTTEGDVKVLPSSVAPAAIDAGRWYRVRVEARGSQFKVLLDGKEVLTFTDAGHPRGAVGLRSWNTVNRFRNLKLTDPNGKVLFEELPRVSASQRLAAAAALGQRHRYAEAAELFASAFAEEPARAIGEDRYNAACCAARAATEAGELDEERRTRFRRQAHDWLRAEFEVRTGAFVKTPSLGAARDMASWQSDDDFRGVREPELLARLPADEAERWKKLWADVAALRDRAERAPGQWRIEGKEMVQDLRTGEYLLLFGDRKWTDYDVELEAMPTGGAGELNVVVRAAGVSDLTLAILGGWGNTRHGILSMVGGRFRVAAAAPGKTTLARWQKVKVEVRGPVCRLFVDGSAVVQSQAVPAVAGQVGLRTFNTAGRFRNIKVSDPQGKVLFEGLPELAAGKP